MATLNSNHMAIQDSNPERKNLVLTSVAFIAFFYGGGSFSSSTIRLQVINADFANPEFLGYMAWAMFLWFIYRYWIINRGVFSEAFRLEFSDMSLKPYIKKHASKVIGHPLIDDNDKGYHVSDMHWEVGAVTVSCIYIENVDRETDGRIRSYSINKEKSLTKPLRLTSVTGWLVAFRATSDCFINQPSFSSYIVPYVLALSAIIGAIFT
jgi:hypothetical protein